jgi:hypothetical protein
MAVAVHVLVRALARRAVTGLRRMGEVEGAGKLGGCEDLARIYGALDGGACGSCWGCRGSGAAPGKKKEGSCGKRHTRSWRRQWVFMAS